MKQKTIKSTLALMVIFAFAACSGDELPDDPSFDQEIKTELVDKSQLPEWLANYIDYLEYVPEDQELPSEPSGIYRFECEGKTYYEFSSPSQNTMHQELYDASGNRILLAQEDYKPLSDGAKNWTIIYLLKPSHEKLTNHVFPVNIEDTLVNLFFHQTILDEKTMTGIKFSALAHYHTTFYVINSLDELKDIYVGQYPLPSIDFSKYTLIVGISHVPRGSYLRWQEVTTDDKQTILHLYYEKKLSLTQELGESNSTSFFYALYPKLKNDKVELSLNVNFQNDLSDSFGYNDLRHFFTTDWESSLPELTAVSEKEFREQVVGYGWQEMEFYRLQDDGSYSFDDTTFSLGGMPIYCYDIHSTTVTSYLWTSNPSRTCYESSLWYSYLNNMVYLDSHAEFQIMYVGAVHMAAVKRIFFPDEKLGKYKSYNYIVVLHRMSEEALEKVKMDYSNITK
jgi:hypothetical protein